MKCHKHYEMDAVSTRVDYSKALCPTCTDKFTFPICDNCNLARISAERSLFTKNIAIMIVMFFFGFSSSLDHGFFIALLFGYFFLLVFNGVGVP